jgi:hypothetical protein
VNAKNPGLLGFRVGMETDSFSIASTRGWTSPEDRLLLSRVVLRARNGEFAKNDPIWADETID